MCEYATKIRAVLRSIKQGNTRMGTLKQILLYACVAIVALAAGNYIRNNIIGGDKTPASDEARKQGAAAILAAKLPDINDEVQAISQWQGKVLVVNFWATWCAPCREEIPEFIEAQNKFGDQGLKFVGIAIDRKEKVVAYSKEFKINYPVLVGSISTMSLAVTAGNIHSSLPFTVVIDRNGAIAKTYLGRVHRDTLEEMIVPLLKAKPKETDSVTP